jgi:hypothetical protein
MFRPARLLESLGDVRKRKAETPKSGSFQSEHFELDSNHDALQIDLVLARKIGDVWPQIPLHL